MGMMMEGMQWLDEIREARKNDEGDKNVPS